MLPCAITLVIYVSYSCILNLDGLLLANVTLPRQAIYMNAFLCCSPACVASRVGWLIMLVAYLLATQISKLAGILLFLCGIVCCISPHQLGPDDEPCRASIS